MCKVLGLRLHTSRASAREWEVSLEEWSRTKKSGVFDHRLRRTAVKNTTQHNTEKHTTRKEKCATAVDERERGGEKPHCACCVVHQAVCFVHSFLLSPILLCCLCRLSSCQRWPQIGNADDWCCCCCCLSLYKWFWLLFLLLHFKMLGKQSLQELRRKNLKHYKPKAFSPPRAPLFELIDKALSRETWALKCVKARAWNCCTVDKLQHSSHSEKWNWNSALLFFIFFFHFLSLSPLHRSLLGANNNTGNILRDMQTKSVTVLLHFFFNISQCFQNHHFFRTSLSLSSEESLTTTKQQNFVCSRSFQFPSF